MPKSFLFCIGAHAEHLVAKLGDILTTLAGWTCAGWILCLNFIAGYETAIVSVAVCVALDTAWGIAAQVKQHRFALSALGRERMLSKWALYATVLVMFIAIERMVGLESHLTVIIVSSLICLVEVWSMSGSALIINPEMPFLRLFRRALTGEIANKLKIDPSEVDSYLKSEKSEKSEES